MRRTPHAFAAFYASKQVPLFLEQCRAVIARTKSGAWFASLSGELPAMSAHLDDLQEKEEATRGGPRTAFSERNVALGVVRADMRMLLALVQAIADDHQAEARAIIEGAGLHVAKSRARPPKPPLAVRYGRLPGVAILDAKAPAKRTTYYWEMCAAEGPWSRLPETRKASTTVEGLVGGTRYSFRFRTLTTAGLSGWSDAVSLIAH